MIADFSREKDLKKDAWRRRRVHPTPFINHKGFPTALK
jgi:hypothetical protein